MLAMLAAAAATCSASFLPVRAPRYEALQRDAYALARQPHGWGGPDFWFGELTVGMLARDPDILDEFLRAKREGRDRLARLLDDVADSPPLVAAFAELLPAVDAELARATSFAETIRKDPLGSAWALDPAHVACFEEWSNAGPSVPLEETCPALRGAAGRREEIAAILREDGGGVYSSTSLAPLMGWWGAGRMTVYGSEGAPGAWDAAWCDLSGWNRITGAGSVDPSMRELLGSGNGGPEWSILLGDLRVDRAPAVARTIRDVQARVVRIGRANVWSRPGVRWDAATGVFTYDELVRPGIIPSYTLKNGWHTGSSKSWADAKKWREARDEALLTADRPTP